MTTAIEYSLMADECFQWARATETKSVRLAYLEIAKVWLEAAAERRGGSAASGTETGGATLTSITGSGSAPGAGGWEFGSAPACNG